MVPTGMYMYDVGLEGIHRIHDIFLCCHHTNVSHVFHGFNQYPQIVRNEVASLQGGYVMQYAHQIL